MLKTRKGVRKQSRYISHSKVILERTHTGLLVKVLYPVAVMEVT